MALPVVHTPTELLHRKLVVCAALGLVDAVGDALDRFEALDELLVERPGLVGHLDKLLAAA